MIRGLHGRFYSSQPDELRAFLRDKLQLPYSDVGGGWLIFDVAEGDIGVHPGQAGAGARQEVGHRATGGRQVGPPEGAGEDEGGGDDEGGGEGEAGGEEEAAGPREERNPTPLIGLDTVRYLS